jgi:hypothetical protein
MVSQLRMSGMYTVSNGNLERIKDAYVLEMDEPAVSRVIRDFQERLKAQQNA